MARTLTTPGPDRTNRFIFYGAVGLALLAAILVFAALANFGGDETTASIGDTVDVVVASQDIDAGDEINADMVELASLPVNALVDEAFTDEALVVGTRAQVRVARGDQLAPSKVVGAGDDGEGVGYIIPGGMVAQSVQVSEETSVGGLILPGDHVNVIVVAETSVDGADVARGVLLLQDVEVLAVAQKTLKPVSRVDENGDLITSETADGSIAARENVDEDPEAATVTLAVLPEDGPLLAVAQEQGTIYLSLRPVGDDGVTDNTERFLP
jgi:pilus assembly protein CpaB